VRRSHHDSWLVRLLVLPVLLLAAAGCSSRYKPVPVSGEVTLNGKPVEGATVYFYAATDGPEGRPAVGTTDKAGQFRLGTMGNADGALPGEYKVVVTKFVPSDPNLKIPDFPDTPEGRAKREDFLYRVYGERKSPIKNVLPAKYENPASTPLECSVKGRTTVKLELTGK